MLLCACRWWLPGCRMVCSRPVTRLTRPAPPLGAACPLAAVPLAAAEACHNGRVHLFMLVHGLLQRAEHTRRQMRHMRAAQQLQRHLLRQR